MQDHRFTQCPFSILHTLIEMPPFSHLYQGPKAFSGCATPPSEYVSACSTTFQRRWKLYTHHVLKIPLKIMEMVINIMDDFQSENHKALCSHLTQQLPWQNRTISPSPTLSYSSSSSFENKPVSWLPLHPWMWSSGASGLGEFIDWLSVLCLLFLQPCLVSPAVVMN